MILEIIKVHDQDVQKDQRLALKVLKDGNLIDYAIVDNTYKNGGAISNLDRHFYSFPDHPVKKDDVVILYTRKGTDGPGTGDTNKHYHYFHWGLEISVWNEKDVAHLLQLVGSTDKMVKSTPKK